MAVNTKELINLNNLCNFQLIKSDIEGNLKQGDC